MFVAFDAVPKEASGFGKHLVAERRHFRNSNGIYRKLETSENVIGSVVKNGKPTPSNFCPHANTAQLRRRFTQEVRS